jgi:hypothetical protein
VETRLDQIFVDRVGAEAAADKVREVPSSSKKT